MERIAPIEAVCVTADIIGSRHSGKETMLDFVVKVLNQTYENRCIVLFSKRMGDEIFGVLSNFSDVYPVLKDLLTISNEKEIPLYVGVGIGSIKSYTNNPHEVNGAAIWNAADAIKLLKDGDSSVKYFQNGKCTFKYFINTDDPVIPHKLLNYMCAFMIEKIEKRTAKQAEIITEVENQPQLTLEEIGRRVGYQRNGASNVSKTLARAEYHVVQDIEKEIALLMEAAQAARQVKK